MSKYSMKRNTSKKDIVHEDNKEVNMIKKKYS